MGLELTYELQVISGVRVKRHLLHVALEGVVEGRVGGRVARVAVVGLPRRVVLPVVVRVVIVAVVLT